MAMKLNEYMTLGAITGGAYNFMTDNWQNLLLGILIAFLGALSGGVAKILLDKIYWSKRDSADSVDD